MSAARYHLKSVASAVILYHHPCIDGVFAALAAHVYFKKRSIPCRFVPHRVYEDLDPLRISVGSDDTLYLCDYVGPSPSFAIQLCQLTRSVVILDHHKSAFDKYAKIPKANLPANLVLDLNMTKSGCTMALDHFSPTELSAEQRQLFFYAEDADLWRWDLPDSREFHAGMTSLPKDSYNFDATSSDKIFSQLLALTPRCVIAQGARVLKEQRNIITEILQQSFTILLGGKDSDWGRCLAVRADRAPDLRSHIGHALAVKSGDAGLRSVAAVAYVETAMKDATKLKISLRSVGEEEDTTVISVAKGGGGHRNASSFLLDVREFEGWRVGDDWYPCLA